MNCAADVAQASSPAGSPGVSPGVRAGGETPPQLAAGTAALRGSLRGPRFRIGIWFRLHRAAESVRHALLFSALFLLLNWATCGGAAVVSPIHSPDGSVEFIVPPGSTVWHHDLEGHYEAVHTKSDAAQIKEGEWVAPPMTFKLPAGAGYASITEAGLVGTIRRPCGSSSRDTSPWFPMLATSGVGSNL